jgi:GTPase SAR1 family protein
VVQLFRSITRSYYRNTAAALIVYDITNRKSFEHITLWLQEIEKNVGPASSDGRSSLAVVFLVGAKADLCSRRAVAFTEAAAAAEAQRHCRAGSVCGAFEVSAKTGHNVSLVFHAVAREIMARMDQGLLRVDDAWEGIKPGFVPSGQMAELRQMGAVNGGFPVVYGEPVKKCC